MTNARHQRVKALFEGARIRPAADRTAFLAESCNDDRMRREVQALLEIHEQSPEFLAEPVLGGSFRLPLADGLGAEPNGELPDRIGHYEVVGRLGSGGMGEVYEARQENPRRTVALKVIRPGIASPAVLRRFEHEAQMLARLQHPGIAQVFEAGTFGNGRSARPFFAMELIEGRTIDEYCDAHDLGTSERLALAARVCDAVHHAHQHGIVHRDLKPGNILVDRRGQPKILDFGVARATDSDVRTTTVQTNVGQLVGTLPYMSPEQIAGDPRVVDTRSDVYAIGVMCYELVTGRLPLDLGDKTIAESARIIQEVSPARLSSIDRTLRGDVETVVAKALEKDKQRRYQSASDLASDIRRHLADEPIIARPASALYHLRKFTKRNRALVAAVVLAFVALVAGLIASTVFWRQSERRGEELVVALEASELEASKAAAINEFLTGMLRSVDPGRRGRDVTVRETLDAAALTIGESFGDQPLIEAELRRTIASSYAGLGLYEDALVHAREAQAIHARVLGEEEAQTLDSMNLVASQLDMLGRYDESEPLFARVLESRRRALGDEHRDTLRAQANLAFQRYRVGQRVEAERLWRLTLETCERMLDDDDLIALSVMTKLARLCHEQGRYEEAEQYRLRVWGIRRGKIGDDHPSTLQVKGGLGRLYYDQGRYDEAEETLTEVLRIQRRVLGEEHSDTLITMENIGWLYIVLGQYDEAESTLAQELEIRRRVFGDEHPGTPWTMNSLSVCYQRQGRFDAAEPLMVESVEIRRRTLGEEHPDTLVSVNNLAALYYRQRRYAEVEPLWRDTLEIRRVTHGPEHPETLMSMHNLAMLYAALGRHSEAEQLYMQTLELRRRRLGKGNWYTLSTVSNLARLYHDTARYDEALRLLDEAVVESRASLPPGHAFIGTVLAQHGRALLALGRYADAEAALVEAHAVLESARGAEHEETIEVLRMLDVLQETWERLTTTP